MKRISIFVSVFWVLFSTSTMANNFYALGLIQAVPVENSELASTEGGASCIALGVNTDGSGVSVCSSERASIGGLSIITVSNQLSVTSTHIQNIVGF